MGRMANIYCLRDPRTMEVRYVGVTVNNPETRASSHMGIARTDWPTTNPKDLWLRELAHARLWPVVEVIEQADMDHACEREEAIINSFRGRGYRLTNGLPRRPYDYTKLDDYRPHQGAAPCATE